MSKKNRSQFDDLSVEKKDFREPLHPPFTGERRAEVVRQHEILKEVYISDYDNYELGFRGDVHPDREISVFKTMADAFLELTTPDMPLWKRKAVFGCIFVTRFAGRDCIKRQPMPRLLSSPERKRIVNYMYETYGDPLPLVCVVGNVDLAELVKSGVQW